MREARRLSLDQVAARAEIARSYLEKLEYGTAQIGLEAAGKLAGVYRVPIEEIENAQRISRRARRDK